MQRPDTPAGRLAAVEEAMGAACQRAGRSPGEVRLLAVTKTRTLDEIRELAALGLSAFGENRIPEAVAKQQAWGPGPEWHMVGHLQSNKAKEAVGFAWLHSLDAESTAKALEKAFSAVDRTLNVLLEANTGGEVQKEGVADLDGLRRLTEALASYPHLRIRGLMTMAPFSPDERVVRPCFVRLRTWRDALAQDFPGQDWSTLSMGMTNDLGWAIEEGSTLVRVGTALFEGFR